VHYRLTLFFCPKNLNTGDSSMDGLLVTIIVFVIGMGCYSLGRNHERSTWEEEVRSLRGRLLREARRLSSKRTQ